jgi:uncharacterized protein with HEPN domain
MPPDARKLLSDMAEAADSIAEFVAGVAFPQFTKNKLLRAAIYYEFLIIG